MSREVDLGLRVGLLLLRLFPNGGATDIVFVTVPHSIWDSNCVVRKLLRNAGGHCLNTVLFWRRSTAALVFGLAPVSSLYSSFPLSPLVPVPNRPTNRGGEESEGTHTHTHTHTRTHTCASLLGSRWDQEQGGGAGLRKLDFFRFRLLLNSGATDIVLVTAQARQLKQQLRSALVAGQWRGDTALTLPLFWRRSTVSPVFFGRHLRSSLHSFFPPPPPPPQHPRFCGRKAKWSEWRLDRAPHRPPPPPPPSV